jgi:alpha-beta hydrolase superfamily lysophospholipase
MPVEPQRTQIAQHDGWFDGDGGLRLYYRSWTAAGRPRASVIIVHGFGEHSGAYGNLVQRLAPAGYAVYGFDLRGHGRSPSRRGFIRSWDEYRGDVGAFVRFVEGQNPGVPLFLLGHSMGGIIVLDYALRTPGGLAGVIAIGPAIGSITVSPALVFLARVLSRIWPSFSRHMGLDGVAISRDPQVVEAYRADPLVHDVATARLGAEMARTVEWVQMHAANLQVPLLIQHGSADRIALPDGSRRFVAAVTAPDTEMIEYPDAFHQIHNDICREAVTADLLSWLERHRGPRETVSPHARQGSA